MRLLHLANGSIQHSHQRDDGNTETGGHIVYISAFALDHGESLSSAAGDGQPDWWYVKDGLAIAGTDARPVQGLFYADVPTAEADAAAARLTSQSPRLPRPGHRDRLARPPHDLRHHRAGRRHPGSAAGSTRDPRRGEHGAHGNKPLALLSQPAAVADIIERATGQEPPSGE